MTFLRTVYSRPGPGEPLDTTRVIEALLDAIERAPKRWGDSTRINASYSRKPDPAPPTVSYCGDDGDDGFAMRVTSLGSHEATLVDWRDEEEAERAAQAVSRMARQRRGVI